VQRHGFLGSHFKAISKPEGLIIIDVMSKQ
jgi:hypothetical protein